MSFTDNFGNPKGLIGRMMLVTMDKEHLPMAEWALEQLEIPQRVISLISAAAEATTSDVCLKEAKAENSSVSTFRRRVSERLRRSTVPSWAKE